MSRPSSALMAAMSIMAFGIAAGYRVNVTRSVPLGLYRVRPVVAPLQRGDLVTFTLPPSLRLSWLLHRFMKPVAGVPGDLVCVHDGELHINEVDYGPIVEHAPIHVLQEDTCFTVSAGHVFAASHVPGSYDSRYYGELSVRELQLTAPVWTW